MANAASPSDQLKDFASRGAGAPIMVIALMAMVVVPLPAIVLDMLFSFNIALSLLVLLVAIYVLRPLDFGVFPTILLIATLFRLALNVASTRVVLLEGHTGTGAAGKVIEAFGEFVIGGNYAVGLVVFAILVIINFMVVTKGAGRISEVSARFTLDAMPGKQMAIDADLNAGVIDQEEARTRRQEVGMESDFYGAMDGASKFVKGDAIAGIMILFINVIGGFSIGMLQHDLAVGDAVKFYTLLTIGDGLVAQIPSLLLSTAAAMLVTRVSKSEDMGSQISSQMIKDPRALIITAGIVGMMGLIPGMPNFAFLTLAAACAGAAYWQMKKNELEEETEAGAAGGSKQELMPETVAPENRDLSWSDVPPVDLVSLEVGYALIPLVDRNQGGQLLNRIKGVRKKLSQDLGFLVPAVHIRDNLDLGPNRYRISVLGVPLGEADIQIGKDMAINPGSAQGRLAGTKTKDPAFGLEAVWIEPGQRDYAQSMGYTVVDSSTVVATHMSQLIQENASQLLGHDEVQKLLEILGENAPKLVEELVPNTVPLSVVVKVCQNLLAEKIPIKDMRSIVETLSEHGSRTQDTNALTSAVREALGRLIVQNINGMAAELPVITLDPQLEQILLNSLSGGQASAGFEPGLAEKLHNALNESVQKQEMTGEPSVLLCSPQLRPWMARMTRHTMPNLHVLSYTEVPDNKQVRVVSSVGRDNVTKK